MHCPISLENTFVVLRNRINRAAGAFVNAVLVSLTEWRLAPVCLVLHCPISDPNRHIIISKPSFGFYDKYFSRS